MAMDLGATFSTMYSGVTAKLSAGSGALIQDGQDLAGVLLLIMLSMMVLEWMLSNDGAQAVVETFNIMLKFSLVSFLLLGWLTYVGPTITNNVNDIGGKVSGATSIDSSVNMMVQAAQRLFSSAAADKKTGCSEVEVHDPNAAGGTYKQLQCASETTKAAEVSWVDVLIHFPMILVTIALKILALGMMVLMLAAYLAVIFMAEVMFGISMALGPILVPWLIWRRTEFLFDGWLKFTLAAAFTKIVAMIMIGVVASAITVVRELADSITAVSGAELIAVDEMAAFLMCVVAAVGAFLMWQAPSIAQALLSGGSGFSSQKFGTGTTGRNLTGLPGQAIQGGAKQLESFSKAANPKPEKGGR
jgi:hypothetical protein